MYAKEDLVPSAQVAQVANAAARMFTGRSTQ
jgi:hypothetical protein